MSENISLIIAFAIAVGLFYLSNKIKMRNYLIEVFYKWFKNVPSTIIHIVAFILNFVIIVGVGLLDSYLQQTWFTLTIFPLALTFILIVTTCLIAVARAVKIESLRAKTKPMPKKKPNRAKK